MTSALVAERRRLFLESTLSAIARDWVKLNPKPTREAARLNFVASNETKVLLELETVRQGYGFKKGEFGVNVSVIVREGPIYRQMKDLGAFRGYGNTDKRMYSTGSLSYLKNSALYKLRLKDSPVKVAQRLTADLRELAFPSIQKVVFAKLNLIPLILKRPDDFEKPFATSGAVCALRGTFAQLERLWTKTANDEAIWDRPTPAALRRMRAHFGAD